jgi:hypothetical protein
VVELWIGIENTPDSHVAYILAGGAIFWLASARLSTIIAYSLLNLRPLNILQAVELGSKIIITFILFPYTGYLAPLIAINIVHILGVAIWYRRLGRDTLVIINKRNLS